MKNFQDVVQQKILAMWCRNKTPLSILKTEELLEMLVGVNHDIYQADSLEISILVLNTKELMNRYNNGDMDKYKLQFIAEVLRLPDCIKSLVKLNIEH